MTRGRVVGVDYGLKRIGIALSDATRIIASPVETLKAPPRLEDSAQSVLDVVHALSEKHGDPIEKIVVGLPLRMNGTASHLTDEVTLFVERLRAITEIPVVTWDERLTSVQADRSLREANLSRKRRSKMVDSIAAIIILQSFLDASV
jgi:putative Holliday junction resolvase